MSNTLTYAIDFGTTNSLLAAATGTETFDPITLDPKHLDATILRSVMYFSQGSEVQFGQDAIQKYVEESGEGRFLRSVKKYLPSSSFTSTRIGPKAYSLEELIGRFLREMKRRGDQFFESDVTSVVLGRPAKFSLSEEQDQLAQNRLEEAAKQAGFKDISFFPEPLAAAYDYRKTLNREALLLVVDLGGGTSDFTVIKIHPEKSDSSDVLSLGGISLAGDALDGLIMANKIAPHIGSEIKYQLPMSQNILTMPRSLKSRLMSPADITLMSRSDIMQFLKEVKKSTLRTEDNEHMQNLLSLIESNLGFAVFEDIEQSKRKACEELSSPLSLDYPEFQIQSHLDYKEFIDFCSDTIGSIFKTLDDVVKSSGVKYEDIDSICCTGGTAKVPEVKEGLKRRFGGEKIQTHKNFHSVIKGLSARASELYQS